MSRAKDIAKSKAKWMRDYVPTDEETEAYVWCVNNHIKISPEAVPGKKEWYISIQHSHKKANRSKDTWGSDEVWQQIFKYYTYYWEKHN